jgi:hypothetical protein
MRPIVGRAAILTPVNFCLPAGDHALARPSQNGMSCPPQNRIGGRSGAELQEQLERLGDALGI